MDVTVKSKCAWCEQECELGDMHEVTFLGRDFLLCEKDFQLVWKFFGGVNAICRHFKAAMAAKK